MGDLLKSIDTQLIMEPVFLEEEGHEPEDETAQEI